MRKCLALPLLIASLFGTACSLAKKHAQSKPNPQLAGTWQLDHIPGGSPRQLFGKDIPTLTFDVKNRRFSGYAGCNKISGPLAATKDSISFKGEMAITLMACPDKKEKEFLDFLKRVYKFNITPDGKSLMLIQGDMALLTFLKM
ncbi:MAG: META domain-containing protein [Edaphocola sp.]